MGSISRTMAQFALGLTYERAPQAAIHEAKRFLLDSLGCALAALDHGQRPAVASAIVRPAILTQSASLRIRRPSHAEQGSEERNFW